jgi:hypothetical protein
MLTTCMTSLWRTKGSPCCLADESEALAYFLGDRLPLMERRFKLLSAVNSPMA